MTAPKAVMPGRSSLFYADCVNLSAIPGIHVLAAATKSVDGRDKPGHDGQGEDSRPYPSDRAGIRRGR